MKRILLTNDDGVDYPGLAILADALAVLGELTVVAPDGPRSGSSMAGSFHGVLTVEERRLCNGLAATVLDGFPVDCVRFGLVRMGSPPDLVVVGINHGLNLASDLHYSGTVGAARDAALWGIPSLAVSSGSLDGSGHWGRPEEEDLRRAAAWGADIARKILAEGLEPGHFLNLNVPAGAHGPVHGLRETTPGDIVTAIGFREEPGGVSLYGYDDPPEGQHPSSDVAAILAGYASLSRLDTGCASPCWKVAENEVMPRQKDG
ncbi:MAG TPA: 5'/3'-nucleotidase SurE [bacterium]|nr:5'/3'-nucleotidase SurE [bacterium]